MPRKSKSSSSGTKVSEASKRSTRGLRSRSRRSDRSSKKQDDFDWSLVSCKPLNNNPSAFRFQCSTKAERVDENPPLTPSGNGRMRVFRNAKGKLRWMFSFEKRSERDWMLQDSKSLNDRKAKKEPNRDA